MRHFYDLHNALKQPLAVEVLHLDRNHLKELPSSILACKKLRWLNLSSNQLDDLPDWLTQFSYLQTLQLNQNQFKSLPRVIGRCLTLQMLELRENQLTEIPEQGFPDRLTQLDLSGNQIKQWNATIKLPNLQSLLLNQNKLSIFPNLELTPQLNTLVLSQNKIKTWSKCHQSLERLNKLVLGRNLLNVLPENFGQLKQLKYLDLTKNKLSALPDSLKNCKQLRNLNVSGNQLKQLSSSLAQLDWLVELDLSRNQFDQSPKVLSQLPRLDRLDLSWNQLGPALRLSSPTSLRVLDLSHNPIQTITALPNNLKQLVLRKLPLEELDFLGTLKKLQQLDLRLTLFETLPTNLFELSHLQKLKGVLPPTSKKYLLQLLSSVLSSEEKKSLFDYLHESVLPDQTTLLKGLSLTIPRLQKKIIAQLLKQTKTRYTNLPKDITEIQIIGNLTATKSKLAKGLKSANLRIAEKSNWCILGRGPFPTLDPDRVYHFFNEAQLFAFMNQKSPSNLSQLQHAKLERLLLHTNPRQVKMALLLLQGQSIDAPLLPALIAAWKLQDNPKLKRQLSNAVQQNQHPDYEQLRNLKLSSNTSESIFLWLENGGLEVKDFEHWKFFFEKK